MTRLLATVLLVALLTLTAVDWVETQSAGAHDNVILITLDGARVEEIFGGLDLEILRSSLRPGQKAEDSPLYRRFWADSAKARRERLLPFFWKTLMVEHGSIAGNFAAGSSVRLANSHRFSYPGYAEILLGETHDAAIKSNDPVRNPFTTVLEVLRERLGVPAEKVATVASWAHFNAIVEHTEGATFVNAGQEAFGSGKTHEMLNNLQVQTATPWSDMRYDSFTFRIAMAQLASSRPRVFYLALGETDDWAHDGRYDRVLEAYARTDSYLAELWRWLQAQSEYKGRTHLIIATDHGRGRTTKDWRDHGATVDGAQTVWIAFASPSMSRRGEWTNHAPLSNNQIAATVARWMGVDWNQIRAGAGKPIQMD